MPSVARANGRAFFWEFECMLAKQKDEYPPFLSPLARRHRLGIRRRLDLWMDLQIALLHAFFDWD